MFVLVLETSCDFHLLNLICHIEFVAFFFQGIFRVYCLSKISSSASPGVGNIEKNGGTVVGDERKGTDCKSILEEGLKDQLNRPVLMII